MHHQGLAPKVSMFKYLSLQVSKFNCTHCRCFWWLPAFFHAYQYLERIGKIRHARFSNTHDIVPLIPFCNFEKDDLQFYQVSWYLLLLTWVSFVTEGWQFMFIFIFSTWVWESNCTILEGLENGGSEMHLMSRILCVRTVRLLLLITL
jgi:hypothetical protein